MKAMQAEMKSLYDNYTYELATLHKGKRTLKIKSGYNINYKKGSTKPRYKVRLVVKGFQAKERY